ncbi:hypothetical protein LJB96_03915 [Methanobrevibacter sp. OttesenSCG-928-K11]|nr:hypothetical protein [Methanobrevibacter sp. OttesenSCG-928-K11]MDL2270938.1 hypothetical protein [Methanobrevibacter sp. OttesenSCG-928-I08]
MANAILAAILSLIIPGVGQLYEGQDAKKGIIFIIIAIILGYASTLMGFIGILSLIFAIYAAYDAYVNA